MDYAPDVAGGAPITHHKHDPRTFAGLVLSTPRLVHRRDAAGIADQSVAAITLDITDVTVEHD
jgi:hypothetical protein